MKYFGGKFQWNVFLVSFIMLLALAFVAFIFAFGYDEGTMRNEFLGKLFTAITTALSYPSRLLITPLLKGDIYFLQGKLYLLFFTNVFI
ncbi:MAG TPA: hypothetical protein VEC12_07025 [Bacteroidia bacterium]|nr:hypothetical protein [Bacteroidia bacterium]